MELPIYAPMYTRTASSPPESGNHGNAEESRVQVDEGELLHGVTGDASGTEHAKGHQHHRGCGNEEKLRAAGGDGVDDDGGDNPARYEG